MILNIVMSPSNRRRIQLLIVQLVRLWPAQARTPSALPRTCDGLSVKGRYLVNYNLDGGIPHRCH
jgi:hypothetical protein